MSIVKFTCHGCDKKIKTTIKHAGQRGKCPYCGATNTVPNPGQDELLTHVTRLLDKFDTSDTSDFGDWINNNELEEFRS